MAPFVTGVIHPIFCQRTGLQQSADERSIGKWQGTAYPIQTNMVYINLCHFGAIFAFVYITPGILRNVKIGVNLCV